MKKILLSVALLFFPVAAMSQSMEGCLPSKNMYAELASKFDEQREFAMLREDGTLFEVWAREHDETPSWTILGTRPDGVSCILAAGEAWDGNPYTGREPNL